MINLLMVKVLISDLIVVKCPIQLLRMITSRAEAFGCEGSFGMAEAMPLRILIRRPIAKVANEPRPRWSDVG